MTGSTKDAASGPAKPAKGGTFRTHPSWLTDRGGCPFDPPRGLRELSAQDAVQPIEMLNGETAWLITGFAEAREALADLRLSRRPRPPAGGIQIPEHLLRRMAEYDARTPVFNTMDPPEHTRYRKALTGHFTTRKMRRLIPYIQQTVTEQIDAMLRKGPVADLVQDFALPIPSLIVCDLLGVPAETRHGFQDWTSCMLDIDASQEARLQARDDLRAAMEELVKAQRRDPGDTLLSALIKSDAEPPFTDDEIVGVATLMVIAGHESTANMLALGTFALLQHPDQLAELREDPKLIEGAVEDLLRYLSITHLGLNRTALADVELGGKKIPKDALVIVAVNQANRDPDVFGDPDALDIHIGRRQHLAFGAGIHACIGQQLARFELEVGFTELFRRVPSLRLAVPAEEVPTRDNSQVYGVFSLPVEWDTDQPRID